MKINQSLVLATAACLALGAGCGKKKHDAGDESGTPGPATSASAPALVGVDMDEKVVTLGALNDESGPAAAIGKAFANGKRLMAAQVNEAGSGVLPEGWTVRLVEKDHAYNPQKAVQHFMAIKDQVLFLTTSFGTPATLPLRKHLARETMFAFPASLSSLMAEDEFTPPLGPSYLEEARRGMDWAVEQAGGAAKVKAGVVYQEDDYGKDGLAGWKRQAELHGVEIVAEKTVAPGQKDVTAVVAALQSAGATHVLLAVLPSSSGPILGTAAKQGYQPVWIGNTPSWIDNFFSPELLPPATLANYYVATGVPFWGEDRPGMDEFLEVWERHGKDMGEPNWYILISYATGLVQMEILAAAIESGDVSRAGFQKALHQAKEANAGGLWPTLDLSQVPYRVSDQTRVVRLDLENKTFVPLIEFATPLDSDSDSAGGDETEPEAE